MKHALIVVSLGLVFVLGTALNPSRTYKQRPEKYNMPYTEHQVGTNDGKASIKLWYFKAKTSSTELMLICHNGEGNMADYLRRVDQFRSIGYNVAIFDYRGFGESSEFAIDNNMYIYPHFTDDVQSVIEYCSKNFAPSLHLYGWGMGAGLALGVGYHQAQIKSIIADEPFLSMIDLEEKFAEWDEPMEVPFAGYAERHEPIHTLNYTSQKNLKGIKLIVGSNSLLISKSDMERLQEKNEDLIDIYVVDNPDRIDNFRVNKTAYFGEINSFLRGL